MDGMHKNTRAPNMRTELSSIQRIWEDAVNFDASLRINSQMLFQLATKRVMPTRFTRSRLFSGMIANEAALFSHFPIDPCRAEERRGGISIVDEIRRGFPHVKRARVRATGGMQYLSIPDVIDRWARAKSTFGVTDLHYIGCRLDRRIDTAALNDFNLLPRGTDGFQSQDSLVISSRGAVTDSHSDDHSGSNHCFVGSKIWLMWDTQEGFAHGLEDVEHCDVRDQAAFDMTAFLSLRSSRWLLITSGETMFIPGNLTHKVITLEKYLGLGSFHVALPGFPDSLMRWKRSPPLWAGRSERAVRSYLSILTSRTVRKISSLKRATRAERTQWGLLFLKTRLLELQSDPCSREHWRNDADLRKLAEVAKDA